MKHLLAITILIFLLISCVKRLEERPVKVYQEGELITAIGYLRVPLTFDFAYSIKIWTCETGYMDYLIVIPKGQLTGYREFQSSCKFGPDWKITYADTLRQ